MARDVSTSLGSDLPVRYVAAALRVLARDGAAELTVRRVAKEAGSSTMGIYTHFGSRGGMLEAIYRRGMELLRDMLTNAVRGPAAGPGAAEDAIVALALAYRRFALAHPPLYALLFERPLPDFDPSPQLRTEALGMTFPILTGLVERTRPGDPVRVAYLVWTAIHGMVSIELTHAQRSPLPDWFLDYPVDGERLLIDGTLAVLAGTA